jgi:CBS domain
MCPACGYENLTGAEVCDNCGAEIFGHDVPQQAPAFQGRLLGEHLEDLGAPAPVTVSPDLPVHEAIRRMQEDESDCLLVVADGRLVGIFTDRDAVLKVAGTATDGAQVRDFMTRPRLRRVAPGARAGAVPTTTRSRPHAAPCPETPQPHERARRPWHEDRPSRPR